MQPPASLQLALTTEPSICIDIKKKKEHESSVLKTWNCFFASSIALLGLLMLNIKARLDIQEFLNTNL